jgi:hypothetical protein
MEGGGKPDIHHDVNASFSDPNAARYDFMQQ